MNALVEQNLPQPFFLLQKDGLCLADSSNVNLQNTALSMFIGRFISYLICFYKSELVNSKSPIPSVSKQATILLLGSF